jgi:hypothetical protein
MDQELDRFCVVGFSSKITGNPFVCFVDCEPGEISENVIPGTDSLGKKLWFNPPIFLKVVGDPVIHRIYVLYVQMTEGSWYRTYGKLRDEMYVTDMSRSLILRDSPARWLK